MTCQQFNSSATVKFSAAVEETLKRISNCGFSYFTSRDSTRTMMFLKGWLSLRRFKSTLSCDKERTQRRCGKDQTMG